MTLPILVTPLAATRLLRWGLTLRGVFGLSRRAPDRGRRGGWPPYSNRG